MKLLYRWSLANWALKKGNSMGVGLESIYEYVTAS